MRNLAIAFILCIAAAAACATARKQPKPKQPAAPTWRCYQGDRWVITLVKTSEDSGKVYVSDKDWRAAYHVQGVNRRWDFGGVYSIVLSPAGTARYYDFTGRTGERINQEQTYFCRRR